MRRSDATTTRVDHGAERSVSRRARRSDPLAVHALTSSVALQREAVPIPQSGGAPLSDTTRERFESNLGEDLSSVRVHHGSHVGELGARAFTQGENIHFGPGEFNERTLAHEVGHVVQQRQGRVAATSEVGGHALNDQPTLEREADSLGDLAMREPIQRMADEEEES